MSRTLITQLRVMQERECASLGDIADQTAGRAADAMECEMQRAEAAEAKVAELEAQNARLRAAQFKLRAAAHHAEIWLTSCLDCKDWMWSEHQHEAATEARDDLKAALNGEEASA